jgi:hypothetical protein
MLNQIFWYRACPCCTLPWTGCNEACCISPFCSFRPAISAHAATPSWRVEQLQVLDGKDFTKLSLDIASDNWAAKKVLWTVPHKNWSKMVICLPNHAMHSKPWFKLTINDQFVCQIRQFPAIDSFIPFPLWVEALLCTRFCNIFHCNQRKSSN